MTSWKDELVDLDIDGLIERISTYNPKSNSDLLMAAFEYGGQMHFGQYRHSGDPYYMHPFAVADILADMQLDDATIVTAFLHDTIEDTGSTYGEVSELFGKEIAELVDGVTKLTNLQLSSSETKQAENFRKLFMAMSKDMRVILVKLADRLHNMRTIKAMRPDKQIQKSRETMDIYAPLAGRMGMQWMREELEDLAFHVLNPEGRSSIMRRFLRLQKESGDVIEKITGDIRLELDTTGIEAKVFGRAKKPYSIWRKMEEKGQSFSRLSDTYGFRVITESDTDCYRVLGAIHRAGARFRVASRTTSASPNRTAIARSTLRCRVAMANGSRFRSARARCTRWRKPVWRRIGPIVTGSGWKTPLPLIPPSGSPRSRNGSKRRMTTTNSSSM